MVGGVVRLRPALDLPVASACGTADALKLGQKGSTDDGHAVFGRQVQKFFRLRHIFGMLACGDIHVQGKHKVLHAILLRGGNHGGNVVLVALLQDELDEPPWGKGGGKNGARDNEGARKYKKRGGKKTKQTPTCNTTTKL